MTEAEADYLCRCAVRAAEHLAATPAPDAPPPLRILHAVQGTALAAAMWAKWNALRAREGRVVRPVGLVIEPRRA